MSPLRRALIDQRGFTMITVMLAMMMIGTFAIGAYTAANGNIPMARADQDRHRAYEAAQAGVAWYSAQLARDSSYWTQCAVPGVPVVQRWSGTGTDTRTGHYYTIPGTDEQFVIELMPAPGYTSCSTAAPEKSMLDGGNLRIRATGLARGGKRQVVATLRRKTFLNYIYFTDRETLAPAAYAAYPGYSVSWANANCTGVRSQRNSSCLNIQFAGTDYIEGPLHTNDESLLICNSPTFGRDKGDAIEIVGAGPNPTQATVFKASSGCSNSPNIQGKLIPNAATLDLPPSNAQLSSVADYTFKGNTCLNSQSDGTIQVINTSNNGGLSTIQALCSSGVVTATIPNRASTVVYVDNTSSGCTADYDYVQKYDNPKSCGDVMVRGTNPNAVTVAARNDVIVGGDLLDSGSGITGLIANNFVRVYHPRKTDGSCGDGPYPAGWSKPNNIDAAILALSQSFIVDNWDCGTPRGKLTVTGTIAQKWRGPVGTSSGGAAATGYIKNYKYDDRLRYTSPPQFLDPVQAAWGILRRSEQSPAT
jgi:type II secretory pathway pseudopilin PulG